MIQGHSLETHYAEGKWKEEDADIYQEHDILFKACGSSTLHEGASTKELMFISFSLSLGD